MPSLSFLQLLLLPSIYLSTIALFGFLVVGVFVIALCILFLLLCLFTELILLCSSSCSLSC